MSLKKYLIRAIKSLLNYSLLVFLLFSIVLLTSEKSVSFMELLKPGSFPKLIVFILFFAFVYPLIGFAKKNIITSKDFTSLKDPIKDILSNANYFLYKDVGNIMIFKHNSKITRLLRMYEDQIVIDGSNGSIVIEGLRKDVHRFSRMIEQSAASI